MRLLMISQDFPPTTGGIQTYTLELARRLSRRVAAFSLVVPRAEGAEEIDRTLDFPVIRVRASSDAFVLTAIPAALRATRRHRLDTAFHVQWPTGVAAVAAVASAGPGGSSSPPTAVSSSSPRSPLSARSSAATTPCAAASCAAPTDWCPSAATRERSSSASAPIPGVSPSCPTGLIPSASTPSTGPCSAEPTSSATARSS